VRSLEPVAQFQGHLVHWKPEDTSGLQNLAIGAETNAGKETIVAESAGLEGSQEEENDL
jgi:hypothetical protein